MSGNDGLATVRKGSGAVLLADARLGVGGWAGTTAPATVDPAGGYDTGETARLRTRG
ncbi:hypothetical protein [Actinacidiphila alni]|uniref:hypothetical protein n=1 Tax=Actinacidiphila alni TaxID=380248 RepID=UPI003454B685